jgi:hypothetical protein
MQAGRCCILADWLIKETASKNAAPAMPVIGYGLDNRMHKH